MKQASAMSHFGQECFSINTINGKVKYKKVFSLTLRNTLNCMHYINMFS